MWKENSLAYCFNKEVATWALDNGCSEPEDKIKFMMAVAKLKGKFPLLIWAVNNKGKIDFFQKGQFFTDFL